MKAYLFMKETKEVIISSLHALIILKKTYPCCFVVKGKTYKLIRVLLSSGILESFNGFPFRTVKVFFDIWQRFYTVSFLFTCTGKTIF